jgi:hypothetical protein
VPGADEEEIHDAVRLSVNGIAAVAEHGVAARTATRFVRMRSSLPGPPSLGRWSPFRLDADRQRELDE